MPEGTMPEGTMPEEATLIKKYENRRLYDTRRSRYVNLEGVAELVRQGEQVQVVEAKSGQDVTRQVLSQIIVDGAKDDEGGPPMEFLRDLVRAPDQAYRDFLHWYLRGAAEVYAKLRTTWEGAGRAQRPVWGDWSNLLDPAVAAKGLAGFWQDQLRRAADLRRAGERLAARGRAAAAPPTDDREELRELRRRLEELESRIQD